MKQEDLWHTFQKTGRVEDYLRYCGMDIPRADNMVPPADKEASHAADNRRTDYPREQ